MNIEMNDITSSIRKEMEKFDISIDVSKVGRIIMVGDGIARVSGLENVMSSELIELPNDVMGMAMNLEEDEVGLVVFGDTRLVKEGDLAKRTGKVVEVHLGKRIIR